MKTYFSQKQFEKKLCPFIYIVLVMMLIALVSCNNSIKVIPVDGIALNVTALTMELGNEQPLTVSISPENATNQKLLWSSSDNTVADISESGVITAISEGIATIAVSTVDGGKSAECIVTVENPIVFAIAHTDHWLEAVDFIKENDDNNKYKILFLNDLTIPGSRYPTFGEKKNIIVSIHGNHIINKSTGWSFLNVGPYQTIIIEDIIFDSTGWSSSLINVEGDEAVFIMKGNSILRKGLRGVYVRNEGSFYMYDGLITNNLSFGGSGVYLVNNALFTMYGGMISDNHTHDIPGPPPNSPGGGVFVDRSTFIMKGGSITGNSSYDPGGGVYVIRGTFYMSSGIIANNETIYGGVGGVYLENNSDFIMSGGIIYGSEASGVEPELANKGGILSALYRASWLYDVTQYGDGTDILPHIDDHISGTGHTIIGRE